MIARIKATGKFIDVVPYGDEYVQLFPEGAFKFYTKDELDFRVDIDWQHYRIQASIAAMQAFIGVPQMPFGHITGEAVKIADALVAELQKKGEQQ